MSKYQRVIVGDNIYEFPLDMSDEEISKAIQGDMNQPQQPQQHSFGPIKEDIDPDTLSQDRDWLEASRAVYKMNSGRDWEGSDEELAEYGLDLMGWFNYNLPAMTVNTARMGNAEQHEKEAFLYLMESYDNLNMSWGGVGRFFKGVLSDPTTYIGLGTLGIGTAAAQGGKAATKEGLKALLKQGLRAGIVAGIEGGLYAGVDNSMRQKVRIEAGQQEEYDVGQAVGAVGVGAGVGLVGGTVLDAAVNRARQLFSRSRVVKGAAKGATPEVAPKAVTSEATEKVSRVSGETTQEATQEVIEKASLPSVRPDISTGATDDVVEGVVTPKVDLPDTPGRAPDGLFEFTSIDDLPLSKRPTSIPYERQTMVENVNKAMELARELKNLHYTQIEDIANQLKTREMTVGELEDFMLSTKLARDWAAKERAAVTSHLYTATDPDEILRLKAKEGELGELFSRLEAMDEALGSHSGYMLRQRQEGLQLKGLSKDDPAEFARQVMRAEEDARIKVLKQEYNRKIDKALAEGDVAEAGRLATMRDIEVDGSLEKALGKDAGAIRKLNELAISNVFSMKTLFVNFIPSSLKTIYKPALDGLLSNPLEAATRKQMAATYSAMGSSIKAAWKASLAAFRYEQAILTRESGRLLEGELALKGKSGALIRIFPRLLNASDEFMSRITYNGFIAGRTAGEAYEAGLKKGLKGKALDKFIKKNVKEAIEKAYADVAQEESIRTVANKGVNLGYSGEKLAEYVKREIARDPNSLRHGHDQEAINYVRDVLYKRQFSGKSTPSKLAQRYEQAVNDAPILRLFGQLFFRTPVRVFEEGIRMTPGVQVIAPGFINDLLGKNGQRALLRAQGEALMSLGMAGTVMTLYAQGAITGDGAYSNWKQQRARTDSDLQEPYTIRLPDGSTWNYRNFDPLATPIKIMVNGLERYENLVMRERQGEFIDKNTWDKALAAISVPTMAIAQSIRDASLMSGLDGLIELGENLADPENKDGAMLKYMGERMRWLVPNTMHKIAKTNDPELDDPATFWQMVESRLLFGASGGLYDRSSARSYDALGNVRTLADTGSLWSVFSVATPEERKQGKSEQELDVLRKLDFLSKQTGAIFDPPYKHRMTGNLDLREQMTSDGTETLYDRWQRYYKEMNPAAILQPILDSGAPIGTRDVDGATLRVVRSTMNKLRDAAFYRLMAEEAEVSDKVIQNLVRKAEVQSGFWDQQMR